MLGSATCTTVMSTISISCARHSRTSAVHLRGCGGATTAAPAGGSGWGREGMRGQLTELRKPRRRRLLPTTNTELNAIAAPAIIGLSRPAAASGSAATL